MTITTYFSIVLVLMGLDAMASFYSKLKYHFWASLFLCAIWPISSVVAIVGVLIRQNTSH